MSGRTYSIDDVKAVILIGGRDFGRCLTATRLNRALWPVAGKSVLQHLIEYIATQGVRRFVLCCEHEAGKIRESLDLPDYLDVQCIEETMPRGTAGCIRDAAESGRDELLFVFQACTLSPPDIHDMIQSHRAGDSMITIFFNPQPKSEGGILQDAQLYACEPSLLEFIPPKGYCDIKEGLIPILVSADKDIHWAALTSPSGHYLNWRQYMEAVGVFLKKLETGHSALTGFQALPSHPDVWVGDNAQIDQSARLSGPLVIDAQAQIEPDAVILGPAVIGRKAVIRRNAVVEESVIWESAVIGRDCRISQSLIDRQRKIPAGVQVDSKLVSQSRTYLGALVTAIQLKIKHPVRDSVINNGPKTLADLLCRPHFKALLAVIVGLLFGTLIVSYWQPTLNKLWHIWLESDEYSSGLLVPFLAVYILWSAPAIIFNMLRKTGMDRAWNAAGRSGVSFVWPVFLVSFCGTAGLRPVNRCDCTAFVWLEIFQAVCAGLYFFVSDAAVAEPRGILNYPAASNMGDCLSRLFIGDAGLQRHSPG